MFQSKIQFCSNLTLQVLEPSFFIHYFSVMLIVILVNTRLLTYRSYSNNCPGNVHLLCLLCFCTLHTTHKD